MPRLDLTIVKPCYLVETDINYFCVHDIRGYLLLYNAYKESLFTLCQEKISL
jgi:hypothetical protein